MANPEHVAILKQGVEAWNRWRRQNPEDIPDLSGADLMNMQLMDADFGTTRLTGANLRNANISGSDFLIALLEGADLRHVTASGTRFGGHDWGHIGLRRTARSGGALMEAADFRGARLYGATFYGGRLDGVNFADSEMGYVSFLNVDLRSVENLSSVRHIAPSHIDITTFIRSKGAIPDVFLKGAGLPDAFISYVHSLVTNPIEFYSCFISYSTKDQSFADRLHADLQAKGVRCWFAPHDIKGGQKIHEQIDEAIRVYDKLLLILSTDSMNSEWVMTEISKARKRERQENRRMLFPLALVPFKVIQDWECFDADSGKDSAREIREYYIPDFSNWKKHDSYSTAFDRLLRDLKAEGSRPLGDRP